MRPFVTVNFGDTLPQSSRDGFGGTGFDAEGGGLDGDGFGVFDAFTGEDFGGEGVEIADAAEFFLGIDEVFGGKGLGIVGVAPEDGSDEGVHHGRVVFFLIDLEEDEQALQGHGVEVGEDFALVGGEGGGL